MTLVIQGGDLSRYSQIADLLHDMEEQSATFNILDTVISELNPKFLSGGTRMVFSVF